MFCCLVLHSNQYIQGRTKWGFMQKRMVIVLLIAALLASAGCVPALAGGVSLDEMGQFYIGDTITISGQNTGSNITYISMCGAGDTTTCMRGNASVQADNSWSYAFPGTAEFGSQRIELWDHPDGESGFADFDHIIMVQKNRPFQPTQMLPPDPTPTPDILSTLAAMEGTISEQSSKIDTQATQIAEQGSNIGTHGTRLAAVETQITVHETVIAAQVVNQTERVAELEARIAQHEAALKQQRGILEMILSFLGLA